MLEKNIYANNESDTKNIAETLYKISKKGDVFGLSGDMGSGKTTFAKYFIQKGSKSEIVPSPSYNIYFKYSTKKSAIYHLDAWRLKEAKEILNLGIIEYLEESILIVEWPENINKFLPSNMLTINFTLNKNNRSLFLVGNEEWKKRIKSKLNGQ